ncbi:alanine racemase [Litoribrevibacter albus]|uniref:Alanine racemase n=1 Tax=Litoribrevibacter albus TaxID=1473156 RepID=A0AA37W7J8_9GAMM|nr:alanine racemase [Litoribrevibacter albus]GLQ30611.1 alanine racemase 1 [Litoribrevibacter albus]
MSSRVSATINLAAISHNLNIIRSLAPESSVLAMVKADAYGHGANEVARVIESQVGGFGVATLDEAASLRSVGIVAPIVLLEGFNFAHELAVAKEHKLDLVIHNLVQLRELIEEGVEGISRVWVKLDTGMHRLGFSPSEWLEARPLISQIEQYIDIVVMTHLACADEIEHVQNRNQLSVFEQIVDGEPFAQSIANSAAILSRPDLHRNWVRPGIMLYGVSPFGSEQLIDDLCPVMTLKASVIALKSVSAGDWIGYGATYQCQSDRLIATVSLGYGDGYPRSAATGTPCYINGVMTELVGRVSMDMLTIDVTDVPGVKLGDQVELWGEHVPVEQVAACCDTIGYVLLTGLTNRVTFHYVR